MPGSKSITNRALVAAALADGASTLRGVLFADDTEAMLTSLQRLGVKLDIDRDREVVVVHGTGGEIPVSEAELDARQSGTTARFLLPLLALGHGRFRLDGDAQLRNRPLGPGIDALRQLGVRIVEEGAAGHLPVVVEADGLSGGSVTIDGDVSSQFLSGLMLAAPCAHSDVTIAVTGRQVSRPYVEMTAGVARQFGATGGASGYRAADVTIEPDASAASYFFAAAAITGGRVTVLDLGAGSVQGDVAFVDVLGRMGATVEKASASITVRGAPLRRRRRRPVRPLRHGADAGRRSRRSPRPRRRYAASGSSARKSPIASPRSSASCTGVGVDAVEQPDGFVVHPGAPHGATIETYGDHRMAMSFALLGLVTPGVEIRDPECVAKTFPAYFATLEKLRSPGG